MAIKRWELASPSPEKSRLLSQEFGLPKPVSDILVGRGIDTPFLAEEFVNGVGEYPDPFLMQDMDVAAERILLAIDQGERIAVYGDYDCDGVTATVILYQYFLSIGADVCYYIPERDGEGYGLNTTAIQKLYDEGVRLLVTVDNGISAVSEIAFANRLGMEVVVTDHHQPGEQLPDAVAVVNPHRSDCGYPFSRICGAQVALKLVAALEEGDTQSAVEYFGDLAAIGTIGDVMPLVGENRLLVKQGLQLIRNSENIGLNALLQVADLADKPLTAESISFGLVPRINAAGRMGSANLAVELLLCEDETRAAELAQQITALNQLRQQQEAAIMIDIERTLADHPQKLADRVLVLSGENWHHGVIGIVCARVLERFSKPNILLSCQDGEARGSARSCGEFSLFHALTACSESLIKFGGHKQAAGLTLAEADVDSFTEAINSYAATHFDRMPQPVCNIDCEVAPADLTVEMLEQLEMLQPFGAENPAPVYLLRGMKILEIRPLSQNKHVKLILSDVKHNQIQALYFGVSPQRLGYTVGEVVDLVASAGINEYNGKYSVSVKIKDIRPADFAQDKYFEAKNVYERLGRGESIDPRLKARILPTREEIGSIYKLLRKNRGFDNEIDQLFFRFCHTNLNYCKFRLILDILQELGLILFSSVGAGITLPSEEPQVDLSNSVLLQKLKSI